ncbi:hypothetical protein ACRALDRAFT_2034602 [Sodiomyces alcalophilus JCM 7366]|uniref:uncharacterized protein n=1 Tax=Sodiomyces alcalophilus JCM 7366 TaxID=591952 RepID=UPI0039B3DCC9
MKTLIARLTTAILLAQTARVTAQDVTAAPNATPTMSGPDANCPTITETTHICSNCPVPMCLMLSTVTQSCGCPEPLPTEYLDFPCGGENECSGIWCATVYEVVRDEASTACEPGQSQMPSPSSRSPFSGRFKRW